MNNIIKKASCIFLAGTLIGTLSSCKKNDLVYNHYDSSLINFETKNEDLKKDSLKYAIKEKFFSSNDILEEIELQEEDINKFLLDLNKRSMLSFNCENKSIRKFIQYFINYYDGKKLSLPEILSKVLHEIDIDNSSLTDSFKFNKNNKTYSLFSYLVKNKSESIVEKVDYNDAIYSKKLSITNLDNDKKLYSVLEEYKLSFNDDKLSIKLINTWNAYDKSLKQNISDDYNSIISIDYDDLSVTKKLTDNNDKLTAIMLYNSYLNEDDINEFIDKNYDYLSEIIGSKFKKISNTVKTKKLTKSNY